MEPILYLHDPFGWSSNEIHWVALLQTNRYHLDNVLILDTLNNNNPTVFNIIKGIGYIPLANIIVSIAEITLSIMLLIGQVFKKREVVQDAVNDAFRKNHSILLFCRGVTTLLGPFLIPIDLIKYIYDSRIASEYMKNNPDKSIGLVMTIKGAENDSYKTQIGERH